MKTRPANWRLATFLLVSFGAILACGVATPPAAVPAFDPTKAALELQGTAMALQLTQSAPSAQQPQAPALPAVTVEAPAAPAADLLTPTEDVETRIKGAKVLLYEDTDELGIGQWIEEAVQGMGLDYIQTGSYSGHFMENLNSGQDYDLIIVGAEDRSKITGEFWDVISRRLTEDKTALIAELWYLDREWNGPVSKVLGPCGVSYRREYPLAESVYWWEPNHPVFNEPNVVLPLIHYDRYWWTAAGDKLNLRGGDATMLAGLSSSPSMGEGTLATCFEGRVIIQTFCNHDYHQADIVPLWQNYIHYTIKNHFAAVP